MNLAIRNIDSQNVLWNTQGSFLRDAHPDLKADYVLANPPFNQSDWGQELLQDDARWKYGKPPSGNANFGWIQHMLYHVAPNGVIATVLANGSLSSNNGGEGEIRQRLIEAGLVECIVALPKQLFYNTGIPACIWLLRRGRGSDTNKTLFIDASEMGFMADRTHRDFTDDEIQKITDTYHQWQTSEAYEDIKGFCKSADRAEIEKHGFVLTPGRYVGIPDEADDGIPFEEKMATLTATLAQQMQQEKKLDENIKKQLGNIGFKIE